MAPGTGIYTAQMGGIIIFYEHELPGSWELGQPRWPPSCHFSTVVGGGRKNKPGSRGPETLKGGQLLTSAPELAGSKLGSLTTVATGPAVHCSSVSPGPLEWEAQPRTLQCCGAV